MTHRGPFQPRTFCDSVKWSEASGAGRRWQPHAQVQLALKCNPAANPVSGLAVTGPPGGGARE